MISDDRHEEFFFAPKMAWCVLGEKRETEREMGRSESSNTHALLPSVAIGH